MSQILEQNPKIVGVTFFFSPDLPTSQEDRFSRPFNDPKVIWAAHLDNESRPVLPPFATSYGNNAALIDFHLDEDQVLRRFSSSLTPISHMGIRLAESQLGNGAGYLNIFTGETRPINYRGPAGLFPSVSARNILKGQVPKGFFNNKIVIVGSRTADGHHYQTPLGMMSRAEVMATVTDNVIHHRWIEQIDWRLSALYLLLVLLCRGFYFARVPSIDCAGVPCLVWTLLTALSLWIFDTFYIWTPMLAPLLELMTTYIVFVGYQLTLKESQTWRLEREKQFMSELDQMKNNFVSLISHDLKTPIAKIQAICDRLLASQPDETTREGLGALRKESQELHRYIQSILQISRVESSELQLQREAIDINELVEKAVDQMNPILRDKHQELVKDLEPMFSIEIDGVLIQEVILNLIENASKYTPNGGRIEVHTKEVDDKVILAVQDNGPGISREDQDRIFEKFYRGQAHQTQTKGTGLGLFLVKYFVELHGGQVFLESESGAGTKVGFALPLRAAEV